MTDNIKLPLVATSDHPEFPVLAWSPLELAEINRLMREAVRLNATVPDGWKLVPMEPTLEMLEAGTYKIGVRDCYRAMLSAAPAAPQPAQQPLTDEHKAILNECRNQAMKWTADARIPEAGAFGGIAQDLDYLCEQLGVKP